MIRLLSLLLFLACIGIVAAWLAENPGSVTIHWFDYRIDTSFAFLLALVLALGAAITAGILLLRWLALAPSRMAERRGINRYRKGLSALTYSVAGLAAADIRQAETHMRKAESLLGPTPLTLLLSAQIARSRGDDEATRRLLDKMLGHKETEYLAARSLSDANARKQALPAALAMAQRAQEINPKGIVPLLGLHMRLHQWQDALSALSKAMWKGHISRSERRRLRGLIHLRRSMHMLEMEQPESALVAVRTALSDLPGFVPAALIAARAYVANRQPEKALRVLTQTWKKTPHPQIAEALRERIAAYPLRKRTKLTQAHSLSAADTGSEAEAWCCKDCGHAQAQWDAVCPACGALDMMEWQKRGMRFTG